jgi:hypothetical protein
VVGAGEQIGHYHLVIIKNALSLRRPLQRNKVNDCVKNNHCNDARKQYHSAPAIGLQIIGFLTPPLKRYNMTLFTSTQRRHALVWLSLFHLLVITSSNYLVQLPVSVFGFHTTWGAFSFPFIPGNRSHRADLWRTAGSSHRLRGDDPGADDFLRHFLSVLHGEWQGFGCAGALQPVCRPYRRRKLYGLRLGQILDVHVFNRLRQSKHWWLAPTASTLFGNISDTLAFFFIAFWRSTDPFMAAHWVEIALVDYTFKVLISIVFFLPMYGVLLNMLMKRLADKSDLSAAQPG